MGPILNATRCRRMKNDLLKNRSKNREVAFPAAIPVRWLYWPDGVVCVRISTMNKGVNDSRCGDENAPVKTGLFAVLTRSI